MLRRFHDAVGHRLTSAWPAKQARSRLSAPIATFTFDDFAHSAWTDGAPVLERVGARATFFVSAAFAPDNLRRQTPAGITEGVRYFELDDVVAAHSNGHEIGCHTFDHENVPGRTNEQILESVQQNASFLRGLLGDVVATSFAYPQGSVDIRTKRLLSRRFAVCRSTSPGINQRWIDLSQLKCIEILPSVLDRYPIAQIIERAKAQNGWLVFAAHDVASSPSSWGCTPALLQSVVSAVVDSGIEILTMKSALARVVFS